jgi:biotin transport system ATP-binding protein
VTVSLNQVTVSYGSRIVIDDLSIDLPEQRIGLIGGNGCGKSTLVRLCNGLIRPDHGHVTVNGHDSVREAKVVRRMVGFVFQDPDLQIIMPTVAEDLAFSLRDNHWSKSKVTAEVDRWLEAYQLSGHRDHPAHLLSGGQKQMLAIAAVLITAPEIVVFDEPTTLLDLANRHRVKSVVNSLNQQVLVVTHDLDFVTDFDRVLVIGNQGIAFDGRPAEAISFYRRQASAIN